MKNKTLFACLALLAVQTSQASIITGDGCIVDNYFVTSANIPVSSIPDSGTGLLMLCAGLLFVQRKNGLFSICQFKGV